jgi:hypothetical protein
MFVKKSDLENKLRKCYVGDCHAQVCFIELHNRKETENNHFLDALLARCGQVHLVFHSYFSELGQINYRPIMIKQLNCKLIPQ